MNVLSTPALATSLASFAKVPHAFTYAGYNSVLAIDKAVKASTRIVLA